MECGEPGTGEWVSDPGSQLIVCCRDLPAETTHVFSRQVMPYLRKSYAAQGIIHSRVLHLRGLTESMVAEKLDAIIMAQTNPTIALYARKGKSSSGSPPKATPWKRRKP